MSNPNLSNFLAHAKEGGSVMICQEKKSLILVTFVFKLMPLKVFVNRFYFHSSARFTEKLRERYREFPNILLP